jgi:hypothetical protein
MSYGTNEVVDQILNKLLTEREHSFKLDQALADARQKIFIIGDLISVEDQASLCEEVAAFVREAKASLRSLDELKATTTSLQIAETQKAIERAITAAGLTSSGSLRVDAENIARFLESGRLSGQGSIL